MDVINLDDLRANDRNPRQISKHDFDALVNSIREFGDLSGIVFNRASGQLVGGHQRIQAFKKLQGEKRVVIEHQLDIPNKQGTVAIGHVEIDGELYKYRVVDWAMQPETDAVTGEPLLNEDGSVKLWSPKEYAANVAANRISGEWDLDLLSEITYMLAREGDELLKLTGQTDEEVADLLKSAGVMDDSDDLYTKEIEAPTYEPNNEKPQASSLVDREKAKLLLAEIEQADLPDEEKEFLRLASMRHMVFDYGKIADFYAHSSPAVQNLMEKSALVIIDYNKAIENGYVKLTKDIMEAQEADYGE